MTFAGLFRRAAPEVLKHQRKVAILGAAGGIGQPLAPLVKLNPLVSTLSLYDIANTPRVAAGVSHVNTRAEVTGYVDEDQLGDALKGADVVIIPAGVPRKPGMTRDDLFNIKSRHCKALMYSSCKAPSRSSLQDLQSPPEPFKLVDKPNAHEVFLQRSFGVEDIEISCVYHDQTYGDNDGEEGFDPPPLNVPMKMVQMTIKISVGSDQPFLEIVCCNFGEKSRIEQVLLKERVVNLGEAPYQGPDISMLTDKLKSGFVQYLEARGIDNELGKFLLSYIPQSAQQKCSRWLAKIEGFVKT